MSAFRYICPDCRGAGEQFTDTDPADPASGRYVKCWLCNGGGDVTLEQIEAADQECAERCETYVPPTRSLQIVTDDPPSNPGPDPWASPKDAA